MRYKDLFSRGIFLTGDGDFVILLEYFVKIKKDIIVIAHSKRTAREIKKLKGIKFNDFGGLKETVKKQ